jgi:hypothetical protein
MLHGYFVCRPLRQDRLAITNKSQLSPSKHYLSTNVMFLYHPLLLQLQFHGTHSSGKLMLCCKNGVLQNILLLFKPRYSLLCSQVCHRILSWIGQGPHPCNPFLLYDKFMHYPPNSDCWWSLPSGDVPLGFMFCAVLDLATSSSFIWLESWCVRRVHEVIWSSKCSSDQWARMQTPPQLPRNLSCMILP